MDCLDCPTGLDLIGQYVDCRALRGEPRCSTCSLGRPSIVGWYERQVDRPCIACGEPIVPGQGYVVDGPLHIYCGLPEIRPAWWGDVTLGEGE